MLCRNLFLKVSDCRPLSISYLFSDHLRIPNSPKPQHITFIYHLRIFYWVFRERTTIPMPEGGIQRNLILPIAQDLRCKRPLPSPIHILPIIPYTLFGLRDVGDRFALYGFLPRFSEEGCLIVLRRRRETEPGHFWVTAVISDRIAPMKVKRFVLKNICQEHKLLVPSHFLRFKHDRQVHREVSPPIFQLIFGKRSLYVLLSVLVVKRPVCGVDHAHKIDRPFRWSSSTNSTKPTMSRTSQ
mmetsp:Transcript_11262/g.27715  ORF Transcript_11262/g.27715 Transcript_11262/m.27715 type:complete len:241 (+) Transcript_11262:899-1621(+)